MSSFVPCPRCRRHIQAASACPFCAGAPSALSVAVLVSSALVFAGCNDPKPTETPPVTTGSATATATTTATDTPTATATTTTAPSSTASTAPTAINPNPTASATTKPTTPAPSSTEPRPAMRYGIMPTSGTKPRPF